MDVPEVGGFLLPVAPPRRPALPQAAQPRCLLTACTPRSSKNGSQGDFGRRNKAPAGGTAILGGMNVAPRLHVSVLSDEVLHWLAPRAGANVCRRHAGRRRAHPGFGPAGRLVGPGACARPRRGGLGRGRKKSGRLADRHCAGQFLRFGRSPGRSRPDDGRRNSARPRPVERSIGRSRARFQLRFARSARFAFRYRNGRAGLAAARAAAMPKTWPTFSSASARSDSAGGLPGGSSSSAQIEPLADGRAIGPIGAPGVPATADTPQNRRGHANVSGIADRRQRRTRVARCWP